MEGLLELTSAAFIAGEAEREKKVGEVVEAALEERSNFMEIRDLLERAGEESRGDARKGDGD